ncbi:MAG: hypothetical protein ACD_58C00199G0001 [uncultured bacterium]|nr:MAG: hypothetical protein ACD_58C00199G0001 [uncultured bacterium]
MRPNVDNPYGNLLPLKAICKTCHVTCHSQILYFFNPDREIFIPIAWSMDGSPNKREIKTLKCIFPQYNSGPLWQLYKAYNRGLAEPIYQTIDEITKDTQWNLLMKELCFFSFLAVPIIIGTDFHGAVVLFLIRPTVVAGEIVCNYHLTPENVDFLKRAIEEFYWPTFSKISTNFQVNKCIGKYPLEALGQTWR